MIRLAPPVSADFLERLARDCTGSSAYPANAWGAGRAGRGPKMGSLCVATPSLAVLTFSVQVDVLWLHLLQPHLLPLRMRRSLWSRLSNGRSMPHDTCRLERAHPLL